MSTTRFAPIALLVLLAASSACARHAEAEVAATPSPARDTTPVVIAPSTVPDDGSSTVREYRGAYSSGYEISWFQPCGAPRGDATWWVTLTEEARLQRDSLLKLFPVRPTQGLAVQWRGTVSARMPAGAGHMGRGSRYMLVTKIISLRALDANGDGACGAPGRVGAL